MQTSALPPRSMLESVLAAVNSPAKDGFDLKDHVLSGAY
jgi:hypothetical protein